jgi:hypothetical protein
MLYLRKLLQMLQHINRHTLNQIHVSIPNLLAWWSSILAGQLSAILTEVWFVANRKFRYVFDLCCYSVGVKLIAAKL